MNITVQHNKEEEWLQIPYEYEAKECELIITDIEGQKEKVQIKLAANRIDLWMYYPLYTMKKGMLNIETLGNGWLKAVKVTMHAGMQKRRELSRPQVHFMPFSGGISKLNVIGKADAKWYMEYTAAPCILSNRQSFLRMAVESHDLLHWNNTNIKKTIDIIQLERTNCWIGDVEEQYTIHDNRWIKTIAKTTGKRIENLAAACLISLPAQVCENKIMPLPETENLRIWERAWEDKIIKQKFEFVMRFKLGPGIWPEIRLLEKDNTKNDIQTQACEVELMIDVGQEKTIDFNLCGNIWHWDAVENIISFEKYKLEVPCTDGKLYLHFFHDLVVQELFSNTDKAILVLNEKGPQKANYRIQSELVENINNPSFQFPYNKDPYISISTTGDSATVLSMKVWGLRSINYESINYKLIQDTDRGKLLYSCNHYRVYENCVEDHIYGDPAAWALDNGRIVLSPVRAVEEFKWRDTPWGDMTRIVNHSERWDAPVKNVYPKLYTKYNTLTAAFGLATDIMQKNRDETYSLPGQQGLMNAALFQGEGEGFGSWVRDTCHAAFRCQNLLAPMEAKESLIYISENGFNNGEDCAAMPAIAAWDYYVATGDIQFLYEMLPGILKYAKEADDRYDEVVDLVRANMCLAQDAFEEPENGGYCLGTEIAFAWMYRSVYKICEVTNCECVKRKVWKKRGENMISSIKSRFWNEEKSCFTSGPIGSEAYEKGLWEITGAEMAIWPRFAIASKEQRIRFLQTIKTTPEACSEFGINWYPFRKEKNHFWRACWVSWTLGISAAAGDVKDTEFLSNLIFAQVRNVLLNKSFHEVMDFDTGRAWRWPHLPWHAAGFIGFIINGVLGITYDENGVRMNPVILKEFDGAVLSEWKYRKGEYKIQIKGSGVKCEILMDGMPLKQPFGLDIDGKHNITIMASN